MCQAKQLFDIVHVEMWLNRLVNRLGLLRAHFGVCVWLCLALCAYKDYKIGRINFLENPQTLHFLIL